MQVDFYLLNEDSESARQNFLLKLILKIYKLRHTLIIKFNDSEICSQWDERLWTFDPLTFIPHHSHKQFLYIESPGLINSKVGINLNESSWLTDAPERIVEIVPNNPLLRKNSRINFKQYKKLKYNIKIHEIT